LSVSRGNEPPAGPDLSAKVEEYMKARVAADDFSGSILLAKDGKVLVSRGYGLANREHNIPNTPQTKFRLGSVTKQFTATAIMLLEKQGKLTVDEPITTYLDDAPDAWEDVTIHHLLSHTGGIPEHTGSLASIATQNLSPDKIIALFRDKPLDFEPGEKFKYSNSGYILLGRIIEKVSGQKYEDFLRANLFEPLHMLDSGYDHHQTVLTHRATGYRGRSPSVMNAPYLDMSIPYAAGALYSTVEDLQRWDQALYIEQVLPKAALDRMFTRVQGNYGYGWIMTTQHNRKCQSHGGGIFGFRTTVARYPEEKVYVVVLSNEEAAPVGVISRDLAAIVFGEKYEVPKPKQSKP
jgi:CubicO group peptidase (beta-lactamase class C family)